MIIMVYLHTAHTFVDTVIPKSHMCNTWNEAFSAHGSLDNIVTSKSVRGRVYVTATGNLAVAHGSGQLDSSPLTPNALADATTEHYLKLQYK